MHVDFVLIGEGPSDYALVTPLRDLLIKLGASSVYGYAIDFRRVSNVRSDVYSKLAWAIENASGTDLFFIHRDADARDSERRRTEISDAASACDCESFVCVVPVHAIEAWVLIDEPNIRRLADNPSGTVYLGLPKSAHVERVADPKNR